MTRYSTQPEQLTTAAVLVAMGESDKIVAELPDGTRTTLWQRKVMPNPIRSLVIRAPDDKELRALEALVAEAIIGVSW